MDKTNSMSNQLESILDDIIQGEELDDKGIVAIDTERLQIKTQEYKVVVNYREGFQLEEFKNRYQEFFEKFDFIVGDWASDMLRLRGFYQIGTRKVPRDQQIDFLDDYLKEYCNFGAAYFVLGKVEALDKYQKMKKKTSKLQAFNKTLQVKKPRKTNVSTTNQSKKSRQSDGTMPVDKRQSFKKTFKDKTKANHAKRTTKKVSKEHKFVIKKVKQS